MWIQCKAKRFTSYVMKIRVLWCIYELRREENSRVCISSPMSASPSLSVCLVSESVSDFLFGFLEKHSTSSLRLCAIRDFPLFFHRSVTLRRGFSRFSRSGEKSEKWSHVDTHTQSAIILESLIHFSRSSRDLNKHSRVRAAVLLCCKNSVRRKLYNI